MINHYLIPILATLSPNPKPPVGSRYPKVQDQLHRPWLWITTPWRWEPDKSQEGTEGISLPGMGNERNMNILYYRLWSSSTSWKDSWLISFRTQHQVFLFGWPSIYHPLFTSNSQQLPPRGIRSRIATAALESWTCHWNGGDCWKMCQLTIFFFLG